MSAMAAVRTCCHAFHWSRTLRLGLALAAVLWSMPLSAADEPLILDDRAGGGLCASSGACWRLITDQVMGGVSAETASKCQSGTCDAPLRPGKAAVKDIATVEMDGKR